VRFHLIPKHEFPGEGDVSIEMRVAAHVITECPQGRHGPGSGPADVGRRRKRIKASPIEAAITRLEEHHVLHKEGERIIALPPPPCGEFPQFPDA
jgi:hypothetical protein